MVFLLVEKIKDSIYKWCIQIWKKMHYHIDKYIFKGVFAMTNNRYNAVLHFQAPNRMENRTRRKLDKRYLEKRLDEIRQQACIYGADRRG